MQYRADIDGLRAVSVIAVVLYHAGVPLTGGYVGVDVFFVISGFLITSLILHEQTAGTFSLTDFYHRRIRRILPALFAMMAACAGVGWFLLAPSDYMRLGRSIVAAALSLSNVQFWAESGYFDTAAAEKPLLHTWSLGVEEQFYFVFPLYLVLVARLAPRWCLHLTTAICFASFAIGAVGAFRDPIAAFYLPQARLWELMVGGMLAMGILPVLKNAVGKTAAGLIGLSLIAGASLFYTEDTTFPGIAALPPTIGALLVIWSGIDGHGVVGRILSVRPLVFLGKISYSLYLWHFPLLAFGFYVGLGTASATTTAGLLVIAFALSVLSWRFVEQPARLAGARLPWRRVAMLAAGGAIVFFIGGLMLAKSGFPGRMDQQAQRLIASQPLRNPDRRACYVFAPADIAVGNLCVVGNATAQPSFVLWGDSHAEAMRAALDTAASVANRSGLFGGEQGCAPLIGVTRPERPACKEISEAYVRVILETSSISDVVIAARWAFWAEGVRYAHESAMPPATLVPVDAPPAYTSDNHAALAAGLERTVSALLSGGKRVWLVGPVPEVGYDVPRYFYLRSLGFAKEREISPTLVEFDQRQAFVFDMLNDLAQRYPIGTIWPHERLCNDVGCDIVRDGHLLYADDDHLSVFGARSIADLFAPVFD